LEVLLPGLRIPNSGKVLKKLLKFPNINSISVPYA
jgi:hypothetical protein